MDPPTVASSGAAVKALITSRAMAGSRALAKLSHFTTHTAIPFARVGVDAVRGAADEFAIQLLGRDFEDRLRRVAVPPTPAASGVDPFGLDPAWAKYAVGVAAFFHRFYFRTEVHDIDRVPSGRVLLVGNHSGQFPLDGMIIGASLFLDAEPPRIMRSMVEKWTQTLPFVSTFFSRVGQVVGVPENARRLLDLGAAILVFPEGSRGISKGFAERYQLREFGLGFMRLALETDTPILPVAVIGAEEQYISLGNMDSVSGALGIPSFPLIPQLLVPGGQLPLPTRYRLYFGEPMTFRGDPDDDDAVIEEKVARVRGQIQSMLNRGLKERENIFW
jgi:1-acyl-sn-glycerol-3-phosphate acyltransferase